MVDSWTDFKRTYCAFESRLLYSQMGAIGTKSDVGLSHSISEATGIPLGILTGHKKLPSCNAAEKMAWATDRDTTREEDVAYCLLGLFGISMPLLYGEGEDSFVRLQEENLRKMNDYTVLVWRHCTASTLNSSHSFRGVLAESPAGFAERTNVTASVLEWMNRGSILTSRTSFLHRRCSNLHIRRTAFISPSGFCRSKITTRA
jgi:hypothetical protein